ncbi:MAG TPA: TonB-dependent receptor, partial [Cyclobacteriaceae bacterium]|nr:TonB-dependent receptor [Cyclobacteriaceae bacterium]
MKGYALLILLTVAGYLSHAQSGTITALYDSTRFTDVVRDIESKTPYRFFYADAWVDTLVISASFTNTSPVTIVEKILQNTVIRHYVLGDRIILTHQTPILDKIDTTLFEEFKNQDGSKWNYSFQRELIADEKGSQKENSIIVIGVAGKTNANTVMLSGYIKERKNGESIPGAVVSSSGKATTTDPYGYYSLLLPTGLQTITVNFVGMNDVSQKIMLHSEGKLNLTMEEKITVLREVTVSSEQGQNVANLQMGMSKIDMTTIKNVPKILGENDIFKVALALPGVKSVGEGSSGLNVRGGNADQNLVTLNEATIYNAVHFLGFFSVFNADAIKSFDLYKSAIPAKFGGRLSSIFDIQMKDGNQKRFAGQGGIGPITSHLTFEVPLKQDKTSLMFGGRSTYSNWVLKRVPDDNIQNSNASFYDLFTRLTHNINDKNSLYVSLYYSKDKYNLSSDSTFSYYNAIGSLQWRHIFSNDHTAVLTVSHSNYQYNLQYQTIPEYSFDLGFGIKETHIKWNFSYSKNKHQIEYGVDGKFYQLNPGFLTTPSQESLVVEKEVDPEKGLENALYVSDDIELTPALSVSIGLRYSFFTALGPATVYQYNPNSPKNALTIIDTVTYSDNSSIKNYHGPEYRISVRYKLGENTSIKGSYNRTRQYIHMLSNTVAVSPTNTWKLSDADIAPQIGDQVS